MTVTGLCFMFAYFSGLILALVRHPMYGLLTYVGVFYLHPPSRWWGQFLPGIRWSLLAAAVALFATWRYKSAITREPWFKTTPAKLLLAYTAWLWIQSLWAMDPVQHRECALLFSKYIIVFYIVYYLVDTPDKARAFLLTHLAGCAYLGFVALSASSGGRLDGVGGPGIDDSNTLGMHIATGALAGGVLMLLEKRWWLGFCGIATALSMNTLVMTGSRGAFLALITGGALLVYLHPKEYRKRFVIYAVAAVVGFGALASQEFWERMNTLNAVVDEDQELESSAESRVVMAYAQLEMAKHYPFGNGHRGSEVLSAQYLDSKWLTEGGARSSHNTFLTALVEQGIPGVILFFGYVVWGYRSARKLRPLLNADEHRARGMYGVVATSSLVIVLIGGLFADFLKVEIQIWMAALLATLLQVQAREATRTVANAVNNADHRLADGAKNLGRV